MGVGSDLCCLAVFDQRVQLVAVGLHKVLQHLAVLLHQELLLGHLHATLQNLEAVEDAVQ